MTRKRNHIPTDKNHHMVEAMAAVGTPSEDMATMLGISKDTLERHYMDTIKAGRVKANLQIGRKIHAQALEGDTALLIWWTKTRMRWAAAKETEADPPLEKSPNNDDAFVANLMELVDAANRLRQ